MIAAGTIDSLVLRQYESKLEELSSHWRSLNSYLSNLNKYEKEVNKYLKEMNESMDFYAPQVVYQYQGKLFSEEEISKHKLLGLTVSSVENNYPYFDKKTQKEIKVKLVSFKHRKDDEVQEASTVRYMVDGKLRDGSVMSTLDPNQIDDISVIKGQLGVLKRYPEIPTPVSGLLIVTTKFGYEKAISGIKFSEKNNPEHFDFSILDIDKKLGKSGQANLIIKKSNESNAIIEIGGELKPNMTIDQLNQLDPKSIKRIEIIKNESMFFYHKKRKLKGYDALIRIIIK
jgi:hypothetical protein